MRRLVVMIVQSCIAALLLGLGADVSPAAELPKSFQTAGLTDFSSPNPTTISIADGSVVFAAAGDAGRSYLRTIRSDLAGASFQAEITATVHGGGGAGCAFVGLGKGVPDSGQFGEPTLAPSLYLRLMPSNFVGGVADIGSSGSAVQQKLDVLGDGTYRVRLTWDAGRKLALFEICKDAGVKIFKADLSATCSAATLGFASDNARLFVGGAAGVRFSDPKFEALSDEQVKAADFGESFVKDPTAGTWLAPDAPAVDPATADLNAFLKSLSGRARLLACWYNGPQLAATRTFNSGVVQTDASKWSCTVQSGAVADDSTGMDLNLTFKLASGSAKSAGVAVAFDFADWSAGNYVLIPASVYNGNRERIVGGGYASGLPRTDLYKKDLQLSVRQLPHLELEAGKPSKIEVLTCNAATPAICFYNHQTRRAFIVLAEQGVHIGQRTLDNGLAIEESADRSHATLVISAPGVREAKPEFVGFSGSPDHGANLAAGNVLAMHLRVYSFEAADIPSVLDKFMAVRKAVTGPNHPRNLYPMSEVTRLMTNRIDGRFYNGKELKFYGSVNADWECYGWVGGLINTFPMLALGDDTHLQRVAETFDFSVPAAQGKAGYFYEVRESGGKVRAQEAYGELPELSLTRRNGDMLFWMIKQFKLLKAQNKASAIKPEWEQGARRLADAFVATWKKDGEWGNYVNVNTGEVAVYNSTSGAMAVGGLALAADYFNNPEYLQIAKQAADFYYDRDVVKLGMTTGACADILQNADSETAAGFMTALMALYETTGDRAWLEKSRSLANLVSTWVVSYDYELPSTTELGSLGAKLCGAVWASTQNKHGAPGFCTSSGDPLFKIYRATGDLRYAQLMHDVVHAHAEGLHPNGEITERLTYCDADSRGSRGGGSTGWNELNGILMAMELPGIYLQTDADRFFVFDHVEAEVVKRDESGVTLKITNPTPYPAKMAIFAESSEQAKTPVGYTAFLGWPKIEVKAGEASFVHVGAGK